MQQPLPPQPPMPPERYRLKVDCHSHFRKADIYGRKGDEVIEIAFSDPVVIVEAKDGNRYPIHKDKLTRIA